MCSINKFNIFTVITKDTFTLFFFPINFSIIQYLFCTILTGLKFLAKKLV